MNINNINNMNNTLIIDLETTGLPLRRNIPPFDIDNYSSCRIIEIGYIIVNETGETIKEYSNICKHTYHINITNSHIHGITNQMVDEDGVDFNEILQELFEDLKSVKHVMAYNIEFDYNVLLSDLYRKYDDKSKQIIALLYQANKQCIMMIAKKFLKVYKYPKLNEVYKQLFKKEYLQTHRALDDVKLAYNCYTEIISRND